MPLIFLGQLLITKNIVVNGKRESTIDFIVQNIVKLVYQLQGAMPPVDTLSMLIQIPTQSTELHDHHQI